MDRELSKEEIATMWIYADYYAPSGLSAIEFYKQLSDYKKRNVARFLDDLARARPLFTFQSIKAAGKGSEK